MFPKLGDPQALADGAAFTAAGLSRVFDSNNSSNRFLLGRFTPGSDHTAVEHRIAALPGLGNPAGSTVPVEVDRLRHIGWFPVTLAALLASLALLAVGHALVTGCVADDTTLPSSRPSASTALKYERPSRGRRPRSRPSGSSSEFPPV